LDEKVENEYGHFQFLLIGKHKSFASENADGYGLCMLSGILITSHTNVDNYGSEKGLIKYEQLLVLEIMIIIYV